MRELDWFRAFWLAAMGFIVGPFVFLGITHLWLYFNWPTGEGTIATSILAIWVFLPGSLLGGALFGPAIGFLWGLFAEPIWGYVCYFVNRRINRQPD